MKTNVMFWADTERIALINTILQQEDVLIEQHNLIQQQAERIKELESRLNRNSQNSSKPPSTDIYDKKRSPRSMRDKTDRKSGGQAGHFGTTLQMVAEPDAIETHDVTKCRTCDHDLSNVPADKITARQVIDIPEIKPQVTEHRIASKKCPSCKTINVAPKAKELTQVIQYGDTVKAAAAYLNDGQHIPLERTAEVLAELMNINLSEGTIVNMQQEMAEKVESSVQHIETLIAEAEVIHNDETSTRVEGRLAWVHVASTEQLTVYNVHAKRGSEAMNEIGILPLVKNISVHDDFGAYAQYPDLTHALCNAHIIRDLNDIVDNYKNQPWAKEMRMLLLRIDKAVELCKINGNEKLPKEQLTQFSSDYDDILKRALPNIPNLKQPLQKKRGRQKQHPAKNLHDRLIKRKNDILRFMYDFRVPFTNNQAERDVRMVKLKVKISGGHRSFEGAKRHLRVRSYISTARKQKISVLASLRRAARGQPDFFASGPNFNGH